MDVLDCMLVTAEVFHFERSELNAVAERNALGSRAKEKSESKKKRKFSNKIFLFIQVMYKTKIDTDSVQV